MYTLKEFIDRLHHIIHNVRALIDQNGTPPNRYSQEKENLTENADYKTWKAWVAENFEESINRYNFSTRIYHQGWEANETHQYNAEDTILSRKPDQSKNMNYRIEINEVVPGIEDSRWNVQVSSNDMWGPNKKETPFKYGNLVCAVNWKKNYRVDDRFQPRVFMIEIFLD